MQFVSAEYRPADPSVPGPFPITWHTMEISPPRAIVPLGPLPEGDWIVRVSATFLDFLTTPTSIDSTERFFRVIVGAGARPVAAGARSDARGALRPMEQTRRNPRISS